MNSEEEKIQQIFFSFYLKWLATSGEPKTINDLSEATGLSRQTLSSILSKEKFKMPKPKTIVALANIWGDELYTKLGMEEPVINGISLDKIWKQLPPEVKKQVNQLIKPYAEQVDH